MNNKVYTKFNLYSIVLGIIAIAIGYLILYIKKDAAPDNFMSLNVAPVFLTIGYLVLIPLGLLYKKKK